MTGFFAAAFAAVKSAQTITGVRTAPPEQPDTAPAAKVLPEPLVMRCPAGHDGARWVWVEPANMADPTDYRRIDCEHCPPGNPPVPLLTEPADNRKSA